MRKWHIKGCIITPNGDLQNLWINNGIVSYLPQHRSYFRQIEGYVLPGLVDMHCHLGVGLKGALSVASTEKQAEINMKSGVLAIRDGGSPNSNEWLKSRMNMPIVVTAGMHISRTKRYIPSMSVEAKDSSELVAEVIKQGQKSEDWVKIVADWIDRSDGANSDIKPLWSRSELKEAIDAAHEIGVRVMAHTFSTEAVEDLLECSVDSIEHGTGMHIEHMQEAKNKSIPVIPTMLQRENFKEFAAKAHGKYPVYEKTMLKMYEQRYQQLEQMYDQGVMLLAGTDAGTTIPQGAISQELQLWVKAGIPALDAIDSATYKPRAFLGLSALQEFSNADLVVYSSDPRQDITVLQNPKAVFLRGKKIY